MTYGNGGYSEKESAMDFQRESLTRLGAMTASQPRVSHIPDELTRVEKQIEIVAELVNQLEGRISCACRPEPPASENKIPSDRPYPAVPLAQNLAQAYGRLTAITARLNSLLERIEL